MTAPGALNNGILDPSGEPAPTPHGVYVGDNIYLDLTDQQCFEQANPTGIKAVFILLGKRMSPSDKTPSHGTTPQVTHCPGQQDPGHHSRPTPLDHRHATRVHRGHRQTPTDNLGPTVLLLQGQGSRRTHGQAEPHCVQHTLAQVLTQEHLFLPGCSSACEQLAPSLH